MKVIPAALIAALFLALGLRLLKVGAKSGGSERWLAAFFLAYGVALPIRMQTATTMVDGLVTSPALSATGHIVLGIAICCFTIFVWRVFRPNASWALGLTMVLLGSHVSALALVLALGGHLSEGHVSVLFVNTIRSLPFLWALVESLLYYRAMVRRLELGLSDAVVANRFRLFAIWTGALFLMPFSLAMLRLYNHVVGVDTTAAHAEAIATYLPMVQVTVLCTGISAFVALWLSFFPPRAYVDRLMRQRSAAA
jgi:hypothetical protein